jgi:hypothetical protein
MVLCRTEIEYPDMSMLNNAAKLTKGPMNPVFKTGISIKKLLIITTFLTTQTHSLQI